MTSLVEFISSGMEPYYCCEWVEIGELSIYFRKIQITVDGKLLDALVLANIRLPLPLQGKGYFTREFKHIKKLAIDAGFDCIAFERVGNEHLRASLIRQQYIQYGCEFSNHFYKLLP